MILTFLIGAIRIRKFAGPGTHNGMRSIAVSSERLDFKNSNWRYSSNGSLVDHVIESFKDENAIDETAAKAAKAARDIIEVILICHELNNTTKKK